MQQFKREVAEFVERTSDSHDPVERCLLGGEAHEALLNAHAEIAKMRRSAVRELRMEGWKLREIAEAIGCTSARVSQLEQGDDRKEKG